MRQEYLQEAWQGHSFLSVYVPDADQMDPIRNLLAESGVHTIAFCRPALLQMHG
jgi:hypothetical protein